MQYEDDCVGCDAPAYPCLGSDCKRRKVPHFYCDNCGDECEPEALYVYSQYDKWLCQSCLTDQFKTVAEDWEKIKEEMFRSDEEVNFDD